MFDEINDTPLKRMVEIMLPMMKPVFVGTAIGKWTKQ
jgi:hypothetical protein